MRLRGHFILAGYGRVGATVARELAHADQRFVVVDINAESLARAQADGHLVVMGDATNDEILRAAGIDRARGLITTIDTDANNVYVTLSARALNPSLFIVARANQDGSEAKLAQAGADRIVSPVHPGRPPDRGTGGPAAASPTSSTSRCRTASSPSRSRRSRSPPAGPLDGPDRRRPARPGHLRARRSSAATATTNRTRRRTGSSTAGDEPHRVGLGRRPCASCAQQA